jgi:tetratricopeptide (TPR) repeat protein
MQLALGHADHLRSVRRFRLPLYHVLRSTPMKKRSVLTVVCVGAVLAVVLFATLAHSERARAYDYRPVEPRLSIQRPHAPFRPANANERKRSSPHEARLLWNTAAPEVVQPAMRDLLRGEWGKAIDELEHAGQAASPVDLSAAYYMRGMATDALLDFCRALDVLRDAPDTAEILFNRALILEQLSDFESATYAWTQYLAKDPSSDWASEARAHLERARQVPVSATWLRDKPELVEAAARGDLPVVRKLTARYPLAARRLVELELLPAWGDAFSRGEIAAADRHLRIANAITMQRAMREERLLEDAIDEIRSAVSTGAASALADACAEYGRGYKAGDQSQHEIAFASFSRALARVEARQSPLRAIIVLHLITTHYRRYEHAAAQALIDSTRTAYRERADSYLTLFARLDWLSGLIAIARPDPNESLRAYRSALAVYDRLGEAENQAAQHVNQADTYVYLGDIVRAGVHLRRALSFASRAEDPRRLHSILRLAAQLSLEEAGPAAAIVFQDRMVRIARASVGPMRLPDALVFRAWVLVQAGKRDEALRDLAEVFRLAPGIPDEPTRRRLEADANAVDALAHRERDDHRVVASLTRALDALQELEMHALSVQLLMERGRAHLRLGDIASAERDFQSGIDRLETQRVRIDDASLRISYFDRADRIFVDLAALLLDRGRTKEAFELLERSRARELLDQSSGRPMLPLPLAAIQASLPEHTVLLTQTVHERGLLSFVVTRDAVRGYSSEAGTHVLTPLVESVGSALQAGAALPQTGLRRLGELLLDDADLPEDSRIIVVPDDLLRRVPYAALRTNRGSYLVESHTIALTPSATLLARKRTWTPRSGSVLIVASNEPPEGLDLPPLTRTLAEAQNVAGSYGRSRVISAADGDGAAVLAAAKQHDILHFAGHSVVDQRVPARSALLIGARGRITAAQIEATDLSNLELVVLGGCNTAMGRSSRSEGAMSLARAFLAASVPAVVSTLAPVEDAAAERLLSAFHREYAQRHDAPAALRQAQLQMLRSGDAWTAFQVIQGTGERR